LKGDANGQTTDTMGGGWGRHRRRGREKKKGEKKSPTFLFRLFQNRVKGWQLLRLRKWGGGMCSPMGGGRGGGRTTAYGEKSRLTHGPTKFSEQKKAKVRNGWGGGQQGRGKRAGTWGIQNGKGGGNLESTKKLDPVNRIKEREGVKKKRGENIHHQALRTLKGMTVTLVQWKGGGEENTGSPSREKRRKRTLGSPCFR